MEEQQANFQVAVLAADASREALLLANGYCQPYVEWAELQHRSEQAQQRRQRHQELQQQADVLLGRWSNHLLADDAGEELLLLTRDVEQQLMASTLERVQEWKQHAQRFLQWHGQAVDVAAQRFQWQVQQLQLLEVQLQQWVPQPQGQLLVEVPAIGGAMLNHGVCVAPVPPFLCPDSQQEHRLTSDLHEACRDIHRLHRLITVTTSCASTQHTHICLVAG
jgi:hypothetical protein